MDIFRSKDVTYLLPPRYKTKVLFSILNTQIINSQAWQQLRAFGLCSALQGGNIFRTGFPWTAPGPRVRLQDIAAGTYLSWLCSTLTPMSLHLAQDPSRAVTSTCVTANPSFTLTTLLIILMTNNPFLRLMMQSSSEKENSHFFQIWTFVMQCRQKSIIKVLACFHPGCKAAGVSNVN